MVVSALTTMAGFGSLMVAKHQGIASLGAVMPYLPTNFHFGCKHKLDWESLF